MRLLSIICGFLGGAAALIPMNTGTPAPDATVIYQTEATPPPGVATLHKVPRSQSTSGKCYKQVFVGGKFDLSPTCYKYRNIETVMEYTNCGGCELRTMGLGHGPVKRCTTTITLPVSRVTRTRCG